jgi:protein TonB
MSLVLAFITAVALTGARPEVPESNYGGATPLNLREWYSGHDHPQDLARRGVQGFVTVEFTIGTDGRMSNCKVVRASGSRRLDAIPCRVLPKRAQFKPAVDGNGAPVATRGTTSMSFWTQ